MANSVDPDQMLQNVASDLGLYCLLRHVCLNTWGKYSSVFYATNRIKNSFVIQKSNTVNVLKFHTPKFLIKKHMQTVKT